MARLWVAQLGREVELVDQLAAAEHHGALDGVLELTHVARPAVVAHAVQRGLGEAGDPLAVLDRVDAHEVVGEQRDVLEAVAQRRDADRDDVDAIEQILAEAAGLDLVAEVAVGRADEAKVDLGHAPADRLDLPLLQRAQQLDLDVQRDLADLVEEQGAGVGLDEATLARARGAGEGALLVAEQLALEDRLRQRGAVGRDQLARGAGAVLVDVAGEQLLAGAALAEQQHGRRRAGGLLGHLEGGAHDLAVADDRLVRGGGQLGPQLAVFGDERVLVERLLHGRDDRRALERLADEVVGAELHRRDRVLDGAVGRHHQDLDLGRDRLGGLEQVLAGHARHPQVGDHHLHRVQAQDLERLLTALAMRTCMFSLISTFWSASRMLGSSSTMSTVGRTGLGGKVMAAPAGSKCRSRDKGE
jgi:hypothetical protein